MQYVGISVEGRETDASSLTEWLRRERELAGKLTSATRGAAPGEMGVVADLAVLLPTTTAVVVTLSRTLSTWLTQRRADVTIKLKMPGGKELSVSARRTADPEQLIETVLREANERAVRLNSKRGRIDAPPGS